jgi:hypothetical protein
VYVCTVCTVWVRIDEWVCMWLMLLYMHLNVHKWLHVHALLLFMGLQTLSGDTPLHLAVQRGHKEMVSLLLGRGADIDAKNKVRSTFTADMNAVKYCTAPVVQLIRIR